MFKREFQFHKGTIRTGDVLAAGTQTGKFQVHKGTIRTQRAMLDNMVIDISIP